MGVDSETEFEQDSITSDYRFIPLLTYVFWVYDSDVSTRLRSFALLQYLLETKLTGTVITGASKGKEVTQMSPNRTELDNGEVVGVYLVELLADMYKIPVTDIIAGYVAHVISLEDFVFVLPLPYKSAESGTRLQWMGYIVVDIQALEGKTVQWTIGTSPPIQDWIVIVSSVSADGKVDVERLAGSANGTYLVKNRANYVRSKLAVVAAHRYIADVNGLPSLTITAS